jgi:neuronal guanine nucleotide exchange factor
VRLSDVAGTLSTHQKKLQEAKFEILSSEASYIKSLNVLEEHFIASAEFNDDAVSYPNLT